ncbi:hypothetical protein A2Y83_01165 [Candidatus Falkowbacteria bacterium RBG_13_39_14]|uniref:Uncharacterized protein n=1 Tax=Candidatus Falkowbacteria bacterium RBG_13_39_14 TaxID=1797985 RepID=A0A1F5S131_9BACT|nr:MAG: hypothetical protein A2Y83_01165 [Candidatus Falkowbacteria bacterium RBG_13_39_14]
MNILFKKIQVPKLAQKIFFYLSLLGIGLFILYTSIIPFIHFLLFPCEKCGILDVICTWVSYLLLPAGIFIWVIYLIIKDSCSSALNDSDRLKKIVLLTILIFCFIVFLFLGLLR